MTSPNRRLAVGAECLPGGGVHFRVWAPRREQIAVVLGDGANEQTAPLRTEGNGYFSGLSLVAGNGTLYRFRLDADDTLYPDPAPRFQPAGPWGPSRVVDPGLFAWTDAGWAGALLRGQVVCELHIGTLAPERTWAAAMRDRVGARRFLDGFVPHLDEACIGTISEVFDAVEPYTPRGCVAQAWSVAEVLRSWVRTAAPRVAPGGP